MAKYWHSGGPFEALNGDGAQRYWRDGAPFGFLPSQQVISGTAAVTAPAATVEASGNLIISGTAAITGPAALVSAEGSQTGGTITGTGALTAPPAIISSEGDVVETQQAPRFAEWVPVRYVISGSAHLKAKPPRLKAVGRRRIHIAGSSDIESHAARVEASAKLRIGGFVQTRGRAASITADGIQDFTIKNQRDMEDRLLEILFLTEEEEIAA